MISIVKGDGRAPDDFQPPSQDILAFVDPSPHKYKHFQLIWYSCKHSPDEKYSLWARVGGDGGHQLTEKLFPLRYLFHASYEDDNSNYILSADNTNDLKLLFSSHKPNYFFFVNSPLTTLMMIVKLGSRKHTEHNSIRI